ncbi:sulfite exporter TauE/SafE family protein [Pricia sp. S334]|uniref:Probable membrane transporter protein n=1 Tax=Pricia mediterranea TaxID=3076079 RepID=A0ABU3L913_9FLAO|nr:sulfite exporter TauE/SafE family protein [Pricia sp. S334]MDT7829967.1 sulfite exporter TauE/SafE family protein [Pricia sp. S334]
MLLPIESLIILCLGFFVVATLYSSVGFGGGSSYLALLALFLGSFFAIRSIALICNLIVVSGSSYLYFKNGHAQLRDFLPFVLTSIPMAFIGASFRLEEHVFFILLGLSLVTSSLFLAWQTFSKKNLAERAKGYPKYLTYVLGGGIGLLSGLVGIGGGIFLAPILNHLRWDKSIKIAALASFFILVNSISGIAGLVWGDMLRLPWKETLAFGAAVLIGGQLGIRISLKRLTPNGIKRVTALLVFVVGIRILMKFLPQIF